MYYLSWILLGKSQFRSNQDTDFVKEMEYEVLSETLCLNIFLFYLKSWLVYKFQEIDVGQTG
jgi:hypothetical protein